MRSKSVFSFSLQSAPLLLIMSLSDFYSLRLHLVSKGKKEESPFISSKRRKKNEEEEESGVFLSLFKEMRDKEHRSRFALFSSSEIHAAAEPNERGCWP